MPEFPLEIELSDSELDLIKGWKIPLESQRLRHEPEFLIIKLIILNFKTCKYRFELLTDCLGTDQLPPICSLMVTILIQKNQNMAFCKFKNKNGINGILNQKIEQITIIIIGAAMISE